MNESTGKKIFFWTLVGVFFVASAIIIAYAFGYRYRPDSGIFIYGGSITLKTSPQIVDVKINGVSVPSKTLNRINNSYHIDGIKPGTYLIEVSAPGFKSWVKRVDIHSGVSSEFWNILLSRDSYDRTQYDATGAGRFFISPRKDLLAYTQQNDKEFSVGILDPSTKESVTVFSSQEYRFTDDYKENIEWSPEAHRLIIPTVKNDNSKHYFIVEAETFSTIDLKDVTNTDKLSHVRWDSETKNALFYMSDNNLYRIDLDNPQDNKLVAQNVASYDLSRGDLYYMQLPEGIVFRNNLRGTDMPEQITLSGPSDMSDPTYQIVIYDEDRISFLNNSGVLYFYNKGESDTYSYVLSRGVKGSQFSDDGKKVLYWTDREISVYFARKWEVQPTRQENENRTITRFADVISNVQWTKDYEHILFSTGKQLKTVELDQRDLTIINDILKIEAINPQVGQNFSDGNLYYSDVDSTGKTTLFSIIFPEEDTILGF